MKVICNFNDPFKIPDYIPNDFDYGLEIGKEYFVMGLLEYKKSHSLYFLVDENGSPSWFPNQLFTIKDNSLPENWYVNINTSRDDTDFYNLIGFDELCNHTDFFNQLLERDEHSLQIYFKRKAELEN